MICETEYFLITAHIFGLSEDMLVFQRNVPCNPAMVLEQSPQADFGSRLPSFPRGACKLCAPADGIRLPESLIPGDLGREIPADSIVKKGYFS